MRRGDRLSRTSQLRSAIKILSVVVVFVEFRVRVAEFFDLDVGGYIAKREGVYIDGFDKFGEGNGLELFVHKGADVFSVASPVWARCESFPINLYGHDGLT